MAERGASSVEDRRAPTWALLRSRVQLQDLRPEGRRVLVRADFNVPVADGRVVDDNRIMATLPTIRYLANAGARVVLVSHRGRPRGARDPEASLAPVATLLADRLGQSVDLASDCLGPEAEAAVGRMRAGDVLLLENLRYHAGERSNDREFAGRLAALADLYVNDAFGASHREHASIVGVPALLPAAAGDLLRREVERLSRVLLQPEGPFVLVLGGAKVEDKVGLIGNLLPLVRRILVGGAMANAFLAAQGREIGGSLAPRPAIEEAGRLLVRAREADVDVVLPSDLVAAPAIDRPERARVTKSVEEGEMALDIGPDSRARFQEALADARTVVWNGPMGVFEQEEFAAGTRAVADAIAALRGRAYTVVGGGDTAAAAAAAGIVDRVSHVSTGGGASLDLLSGSILAGVAALSERSE